MINTLNFFFKENAIDFNYLVSISFLSLVYYQFHDPTVNLLRNVIVLKDT